MWVGVVIFTDRPMRGVFGEIGFNGVVEVLGCVSDAAKNKELKNTLGQHLPQLEQRMNLTWPWWELHQPNEKRVM